MFHFTKNVSPRNVVFKKKNFALRLMFWPRVQFYYEDKRLPLCFKNDLEHITANAWGNDDFRPLFAAIWDVCQQWRTEYSLQKRQSSPGYHRRQANSHNLINASPAVFVRSRRRRHSLLQLIDYFVECVVCTSNRTRTKDRLHQHLKRLYLRHRVSSLSFHV